MKRILGTMLTACMLLGTMPVSAAAAGGAVDTWDGTADKDWYNDTDTEFTITTAEQLAGLAVLVDGGNTFEGKTVKLGNDIDLQCKDENGELVSFQPIGSYAFGKEFRGIFDGQGHFIFNMYQNGWALKNGVWDGDDLGLGLFGKVRNTTIKDLNIDSANLPSEANLIGSIAGAAYGHCVFENINITNTYTGNHSYYSGSIVGWASGNHEYINCDVYQNTVISSQWGDFNNANGGIIGGAGVNGTYYFKDCDIACVIDAYNDYTSAYEWANYRSCGMLVGSIGHTVNDEAVTYVAAPNVTAVNCNVVFGDWSEYHYCEFTSAAYPYCRVEPGKSTSAYGNARIEKYYDADGNIVKDDNHTHREGEDHNRLFKFTYLFGGPAGDRYCKYGISEHTGVSVYGAEEGNGYNQDKNATSHWYENKDGKRVLIEDHIYTDWTVTSEPTNTENGSHWRKCVACGYEDEQTLPKLLSGFGAFRQDVYRIFSQMFEIDVDVTLVGEDGITVDSTKGGTVTSKTGSSTVLYDRNITFSITPEEGYRIADVLYNGESVGAVTEFTAKRVKADGILEVIFEKIPEEPAETAEETEVA